MVIAVGRSLKTHLTLLFAVEYSSIKLLKFSIGALLCIESAVALMCHTLCCGVFVAPIETDLKNKDMSRKRVCFVSVCVCVYVCV